MRKTIIKFFLIACLFSIFAQYLPANASCIGWDNKFKALKCYPDGDASCNNLDNPSDPVNGEAWKLLGPWFGIKVHNEVDCTYLKYSAVHYFCQSPTTGKCFAKSPYILINSPCNGYPTAKEFNSYYECCLDKSTCITESIGSTESITKLPWDVSAPTLNIRIPGLTFSDIQNTIIQDTEGNKYVNIPWVGEYITSVYSFSLGIVSIVAVFMIIIQGLVVITSGGGERKQSAYKKIGQVAIGLVIIWSSYLILYNINPELVQFKALRVQIIEPIDLTYSISKTEGGDPLVKLPAKIVKTEAEPIAYREALRHGFNACLFKVQIRKESGWDTNVGSRCCYGLGQIDWMNAQKFLQSSRGTLIARHSKSTKAVIPSETATKEEIAKWLMEDYESNIIIAASLRASAGKQGNPIAAAAIYGMGAGSYNLYLKVKPCTPLEKYNSETKVLAALKTDTVDDLIKGSCIPPITWAIPGNKAKGIEGCPGYYHCCNPAKLPACEQPPSSPVGRKGVCGGGTRYNGTCFAVAGAETYIRAFIKEIKECAK